MNSSNFIRRLADREGVEQRGSKLDQLLDEFEQTAEREARRAERREEAKEPAPRGLPAGCFWSRRKIN